MSYFGALSTTIPLIEICGGLWSNIQSLCILLDNIFNTLLPVGLEPAYTYNMLHILTTIIQMTFNTMTFVIPMSHLHNIVSNENLILHYIQVFDVSGYSSKVTKMGWSWGLSLDTIGSFGTKELVT